MTRLRTLLHDERANAALGWTVACLAALAGIGSLLTDAVLWGAFALVVVAVIALPALATGDWTVMVPWPLALVASLAVGIRAMGRFPEVTGYVAVATVSLVAVVSLAAYTSVDLSRRFAVAFAVLTTMAAEALWLVAEYYSDLWLGTQYIASQTELQWDLVAVTVVAVVLGAAYELYVRRYEHVGSHARPAGRRGSP